MSFGDNYYNVAAAGVVTLAVIGGSIIYNWCIKKPQANDERVTQAVSRALQASADGVGAKAALKDLSNVDEAGVFATVETVRDQVLSPDATPADLIVMSGAEMAATEKREQEVRLAEIALAFFTRPLEEITPEQYVEFTHAVEGFNLLGEEERSSIIIQQFAPKHDEAFGLLGKLKNDGYINAVIATRCLSLKQSMQTCIDRVRQLRGTFGNDGLINAAYARGEEAEKERLYSEYAEIGGEHFNPDKDVDVDTGRYRVASGSQINKLQDEAFGLIVTHKSKFSGD